MKQDSATRRPTILTNMALWQSAEWMHRADSLYALSGLAADPAFHPPWKEALLLWRRRRNYDVVLTMGARESLVYGLLCLLTLRSSRQIMTEVFIDRARPWNPAWRLKRLAYRIIARRGFGILTNSSAEVRAMADRFHLPEDRLRYVPLHSNIQQPEESPAHDGFVLSAGRTLRDYATLLRAAPRIRAPVVIICGTGDLPGMPAPANVTLLREIGRDAYLDHLHRCAVMALPLQESERSTGQVVLLEAMAVGKPVITTRAPGTADHIRHGENGILIPVGDAEALADGVNQLLAHPEQARRLAGQALRDIRERHTFSTHVKYKLAAIEDLWRTGAASRALSTAGSAFAKRLRRNKPAAPPYLAR